MESKSNIKVAFEVYHRKSFHIVGLITAGSLASCQAIISQCRATVHESIQLLYIISTLPACVGEPYLHEYEFQMAKCKIWGKNIPGEKVGQVTLHNPSESKRFILKSLGHAQLVDRLDYYCKNLLMDFVGDV